MTMLDDLYHALLQISGSTDERHQIRRWMEETKWTWGGVPDDILKVLDGKLYKALDDPKSPALFLVKEIVINSVVTPEPRRVRRTDKFNHGHTR